MCCPSPWHAQLLRLCELQLQPCCGRQASTQASKASTSPHAQHCDQGSCRSVSHTMSPVWLPSLHAAEPSSAVSVASLQQHLGEPTKATVPGFCEALSPTWRAPGALSTLSAARGCILHASANSQDAAETNGWVIARTLSPAHGLQGFGGPFAGVPWSLETPKCLVPARIDLLLFLPGSCEQAVSAGVQH